MPLLLVILILLGFAGGLNTSGTNQVPVNESDVIVSSQFGGIARNTTQQQVAKPATAQNSSATRSPVVEQANVPVIEVPPILDTFSAQDIKTNTAKLRGEIEYIGAPYRGKLYFIYSKNISEVIAVSDSLPELRVSSAVNSGGVYTRFVSGLEDDTTYYYRLCFEADVKTCADIVSLTTVEKTVKNDTYTLPSVTTKRATKIQAENATLEGSYRLNDAEFTYVFFVYGQDRTLVSEVPSEYGEYRDVREFGDDLQKVRVGVNVPSSGEFTREVDDLEKDTKYYHRLCIAYDDDEATGIKCGSVLSFETKSKQRDIPEIRLTKASISGQSAELSTLASMEDYRNGHLFVVYGISESRVNDVAKKDEFNQVSQYGDQLQRLSIDSDFDGTDTVSVTAADLLEASYFYRFCIEYEAENDYGNDDLFLSCGEVETFIIE